MKQGYKTTEFWLAIVAAIIPVLNRYLDLDIPEDAFYAILAYILGRCGIKIAEVRKG